MPHTISSLAAEVLTFFKRGEREAPGIGPIFIRTDNCPQWVEDMCFAAHGAGSMLPDDWRYEFISDALSLLTDDNNDEDALDEWLDGAYCYYHEQLAWLSSRNDRMCYCDDAVEELDMKDADMNTRIKLGMDAEIKEVYHHILEALKEKIQELEDEAEIEAEDETEDNGSMEDSIESIQDPENTL